jgi:pentatricopeptide repeat protein
MTRMVDKKAATNAVMSFVVTPRPGGVTFSTVLSACERSSQWNAALNVARAAAEYGVSLDEMALTLVLHSCQQLGLTDEALYYLELMKRLRDDEGGVDHDRNGEGQVVGGSAMQQWRE